MYTSNCAPFRRPVSNHALDSLQETPTVATQLSLSTTWRAGAHSRAYTVYTNFAHARAPAPTLYKEAHTARFIVYREANLIRSNVIEAARRHTLKPNKTLSEPPLFEWMEYCGRASGYTINTRSATEECRRQRRRQTPGSRYSTTYEVLSKGRQSETGYLAMERQTARYISSPSQRQTQTQ